MIVCGWCNADTAPGSCSSCGRDPAIPWLQRSQTPPPVDAVEIHRRLIDRATVDLRSLGLPVTVDGLSERIGVDARTVRRWRADVRPTP